MPKLVNQSSCRTAGQEYDNELYQLKVDVGMLNTVKNYWADISSVNPSSKEEYDRYLIKIESKSKWNELYLLL